MRNRVPLPSSSAPCDLRGLRVTALTDHTCRSGSAQSAPGAYFVNERSRAQELRLAREGLAERLRHANRARVGGPDEADDAIAAKLLQPTARCRTRRLDRIPMPPMRSRRRTGACAASRESHRSLRRLFPLLVRMRHGHDHASASSLRAKKKASSTASPRLTAAAPEAMRSLPSRPSSTLSAGMPVARVHPVRDERLYAE
jgi:hypothetical protein